MGNDEKYSFDAVCTRDYYASDFTFRLFLGHFSQETILNFARRGMMFALSDQPITPSGRGALLYLLRGVSVLKADDSLLLLALLCSKHEAVSIGSFSPEPHYKVPGDNRSWGILK
jgi:hypothetical protein